MGYQTKDAASSVRLRARVSASAGALIMFMLATPAFAQQATAAGAAPSIQSDGNAAAPAAEIVVTGSRIRSSGFAAPTPTQVLGAADLARNAEPNVFNTIVQLPSLQGSSGSSTNTFSTSSGQQGLSSF